MVERGRGKQSMRVMEVGGLGRGSGFAGLGWATGGASSWR